MTQIANLVEFLSEVEMFALLSSQELEQLAAQASVESYELGDVIRNAGDPCDGPLVVLSGSVRLFTDDNGKEVSMGLQKTGQTVAVVGALRDVPHSSSIRASGKCELASIPRSAIAEVGQTNPEYLQFLTTYAAIRATGSVFNRLFNLKGKLKQDELRELVSGVGIKQLRAGDTILAQDAMDDRRLYTIRQGTVKLVREERGNEYVIKTLGPGEVFGEKAAMKGGVQFASAVAQTDVAVMAIPDTTIKNLAEQSGAVERLMEDRISADERELDRQLKLAEQRRRPPIFDLVSSPRMGERVLKRFQLVEQAEEMDCGAACLAMLCQHHKIPVTLGKLREMANVTTDGATLDSLSRVGEALGFTTQGVECSFDHLIGFELPFIAHWEGYHYIIVYGVSEEHVWVADPGRGFAKMTQAEFEKGWSGTCLTFTPGTELYQDAASASPWIRFVRYLAPFKGVLGYIILATLVVEVLGIAPPIIVQQILDSVVVHAEVSLLNVLIVGLIIAQVFSHLTTLMRGYLTTYLIRNLDFAMISQFFRHALSLPLSFFDKRRTGDIFARFQENQTVRDFLTESTISTLLNVLMVFLYLIVLFLYSVKLTLLMIATIIPVAILTFLVTPKLKAYARADFEASTDAESVLMETISGAETVKAMGIERSMRRRWEKRYAKSLTVRYNAGRFDLLVAFAGNMMTAASTVLVLWVGANMVLEQTLTIGQLIAFNMLMGSVMSPLLGLINLWDELQETRVAMERLGDVLDIEPEQKPSEVDSRVILPEVHGDVRLDEVYFRYDVEGAYVLERISLAIEAGETVALVGQSGSGKTTLAKLIAGFYQPDEGAIYIDGYDLSVVDKEHYRSQLGYVMQSNLLFSGTVAENIAAGEDNPDKRRVMEVARLADADGFINKLPLGYDQPVGERGIGLSGGQNQRLCIARALYHNPRILILDEATSALDSQSESNILDNMQAMLEGRTAIIIAHRLSTIMNADKIVVLYEGGIVEQGTHAELLERQGMYHQLVQSQLAAQG